MTVDAKQLDIGTASTLALPSKTLAQPFGAATTGQALRAEAG
jgi:hypothetical protein